MCSKCQDILIGYSIPHVPKNCPLNRVTLCSICARHTDHTTEECPQHEVKQFRRVQFLEQLIPHSQLTHYNITSMTPIPEPKDLPKPKYLPKLELENTDKARRQFLMNYNIQPSGRFKENIRLVEDEANKLGRTVEYFDPK